MLYTKEVVDGDGPRVRDTGVEPRYFIYEFGF